MLVINCGNAQLNDKLRFIFIKIIFFYYNVLQCSYNFFNRLFDAFDLNKLIIFDNTHV